MTANAYDVSRRRLFQIAGIGPVAAVGLAGASACSQASPDVSDGSFHTASKYQQPPDGHYNMGGAPYAGVPGFINDGAFRDLLIMPSGLYYWHDESWMYLLAESSELDTDEMTFTVNIREGLTWDDGEPLTSDDYMTSLWLQWLQRAPAWSSIESIEATDDHTVVVHLQNPSAVVERYVLRANIVASHNADENGKTYGDFAAEAEALFDSGEDMDSEAGSELGEEFQDFRPEKLIYSGPFMIDPDRMTDNQMTLVRNDNGYAADTVKFDEIVIYNGETPEVDPLVQDGAVDYATNGFSPNQEQAHVDSGRRILRPPNYNGPALYMNFDRLPQLQDVQVRRALAHAINRETNGAVALADSGVPVEYMIGFSDVQVHDWLDDDAVDALHRYEHNPDEATRLLEEAGWEKNGDSWTMPDGEPASFEIVYPGDFADWAAAGDDVAEQLSDFGIDVTANPVDFQRYETEMLEGEFQLAIQSWGSSQHPHPHFAFVSALFNYNTPIAQNSGGDGMAFDLNVETDAYGQLDLEEVVNDAGSGLDEAEQRENVTRAAVAFNELLPIIPLFERYGNNPVQEGEGTRVDAFPDDDDPLWQNSPYADNPVVMLMLSGELEPYEE